MTAAAKEPALGLRRAGVGETSVSVGVDVAALHREHWRALVRLAVLLVDDVGAAEDVVQDAFVALHRHQAALRSADSALAYLRRSVVNLSRSVLRRRYTVRQHQPRAGIDTVEAADAAFWLGEEQREVLSALRRLPRRQREVLILRYWSELTEAQIAAALDISAGSVKSAASRGIRGLKIAMEGRQ